MTTSETEEPNGVSALLTNPTDDAGFFGLVGGVSMQFEGVDG